ncbi:ABC transporter substrate-binding protein [Actinocorallia sp. A-T 12471]|uniref:ABC transporter substrate-binding protein n=1 Tax=Actinocorallia sp. A-T 12471 TaxID=3089813 RepID=UPI0029D04CEE|nr:ABC transporter substrate-binding protein [Actinocorallia sp. A-T 12471]MDX6744073.1 ABC transporter substrate-binding protein [Actinocorallia sp. A-T 12471]
MADKIFSGAAVDRRGFLRGGIALGGVAVGGGLLSACGGPGGSTGASDGGGPLTIGTVIVDDTLNPMQEQYTTFQFNAFDALVRQLRGDDEATPRLAEEWSRSSDTVWKFKLRQGVTFHDGSPVTVEDIVFSFTELAAQQYANATAVATIKEVRKVDATTLRIETTAPDPLLLARIGQVFVVPEAHWKKVGADGFTANPIGSGAFKIDSFQVDSGIEFSAYDGFYGAKPKTPNISLRYFTDPGALASALEAGEIDAAQNLGAESIKTLAGRDDLTVKADFSGNQNMLQLNTTKAPFDDVRVRRAAVMAVDAAALNDAINFGAGTLEDGQVAAEGVFGYDKSLKRTPYDLAGAKKLLKEAGAEGAEIEIFGMNLYKKLYEAVGAQLQEAGFKPKISAVEVPVWVQTFRNGSDADVFYRGASYTGIFDADRMYGHVSSSKKPFVKDAKWDRLLEAERTEMDPDKREKKLHACAAYLNEQAYVLHTYAAPTVGGFRKGVSGFDNTNGLMLLLDSVVKEG